MRDPFESLAPGDKNYELKSAVRGIISWINEREDLLPAERPSGPPPVPPATPPSNHHYDSAEWGYSASKGPSGMYWHDGPDQMRWYSEDRLPKEGREALGLDAAPEAAEG